MTVWTIGHSNRTIEDFVDLLLRVEITAIADVRSLPYSKYTPQFNGETLSTCLSKARIHYVFLGNYLGARPSDLSVYVSRRVCFSSLVSTSFFHKGLDRVKIGATRFRLALMCSEKDPIQCHRMALVGHELKKQGVNLIHILDDGIVESNADAEMRLRHAMGINDIDLFRSQEELVEDAYTKLVQKIAFTSSEDSGN